MTAKDSDGAPRLPAGLAWLQRLVVILMLTMIAGIAAIVFLIATRMPRGVTVPELPAGFAAPAGETVTGLSLSGGLLVAITRDSTGRQHLHVIDPATGGIRQTVAISP
jgi:hypothetical protein